MIDVATEHLVSLAEACKLLPTRRGGRPVHVSCMYRWTQAGCKGVKLEFIQIGGTRCTSHEALARFFELLTVAHTGVSISPRTPAQRERAVAEAEAELKQAGI